MTPTKTMYSLILLFAITPAQTESAFQSGLPSPHLADNRHVHAMPCYLRSSLRSNEFTPPSSFGHLPLRRSTTSSRAQKFNEYDQNMHRNKSEVPYQLSSRRSSMKTILTQLSVLISGVASSTFDQNSFANAAPPVAIIAEELGYFPVTNREGTVIYVPAKVRRESSKQSILLAKHLTKIGVTMYGTYWCPHCQHQKEIFGREAWSSVTYVECSTNGYRYDSKLLPPDVMKEISGFPTWKIPAQNVKNIGNVNSKYVSGEMTLEMLANLSGYKGGFDRSLEVSVPSQPGACS